ncbi:MAG: PQQ-binding-like beta-propeller repeat protein [Planctomycetota bacterium]|nr:PQQ-binding-like beta-propeller repeat protein [Planctomycetota bacterium]
MSICISGNVNFRFAQLLLCLACLRHSSAGDWPMYRKDTRRSGISDESLSFPMRLKWRYTCAQAPRPAWPNPPRLYNKLDFDFAPHPVIVDRQVFFCSNSDDTLRVLDANTGKPLWQYTAGGPLRFAPQVLNERVYFASDDARIYCLDSKTGDSIWTFDAAPKNEMFIGNGRMISRWPVRTGIVVEENVVYGVAGMWPSEGIYVYALNAETGTVIWVNDKDGLVGNYPSGTWRPQDPHTGEFSFTGPTPQGAILASRDTLIVPLGNNSSAAYSKKTGGLVRFIGQGSGASNITGDGDMFYGILSSRAGISVFGGRAADKGVINRSNRFDADQVPQVSTAPTRSAGVSHSAGRISFVVQNEKLYATEAFSLAMSGEMLLIGRLNSIAAIERESRREIWSTTVNGEAREIGVAEGNLYVSTDSGEISCFSSSESGAPHIHTESKAGRAEPETSSNEVIRELVRTRADKGYVLIVGALDSRLSVDLALNTESQVIQIAGTHETAAKLRRELLSTTSLYGSRIHVINIGEPANLPFSQFFANAVIVAGQCKGLDGAELYRVLRPYGGVLLCPGLKKPEANMLIESIPKGKEFEIVELLGKSGIVRGHLKGARDWNSNVAADQLVRWPLRPIWFGGPESSLVMNYGIGAHPPVAASGRYFVMGQDTLTAVDAYNGTKLWTRSIPSATPDTRTFDGLQFQIQDGMASTTTQQWSVLKRWIAADGKSVYLRLGQNYFKEEGEALVQMDALDGRVTKVIAPLVAAPTVSLMQPQTWNLSVDAGHHGTLSLSSSSQGIHLELSSSDTVITPVDAWDLFFDFRPPANRYGLYGRGTFKVTVSPGIEKQLVRITQGDGMDPLRFELQSESKPHNWSASLLLKWEEVERFTRTRPKSFGFGATFNAYNGPENFTSKSSAGDMPLVKDTVRQLYLFTDANSPTLNIGWANINLGEGEEQVQPSVVAEKVEERPKEWPFPDFFDDVYIGDPGRIDTSLQTRPRRHPLTGEPGPRIFRSGTAGCGNPIFSSTNAIGRTSKQALGFYDFEDDSGLRFFPGIATNCGARVKAINMTAALGLLLFSDSRSHCSCMIPIRTSMAFAPAERRLQEDWAIFFERGLDAPLKHAFLNLGAFGDRRDEEGRLWLQAPRRASGRAFPIEPGTRRWIFDAPPMKSTLDVPVEIVRDPKVRGGAYRTNADRVQIAGTARPWLYTSGYKGIVSLKLKLLPQLPIASKLLNHEPRLDGQIDELGEGEKPELSLPFTGTDVFFRHTEAGLYVVAHRKPIVGRRGDAAPYTARAKKEDEVFTDDCFELFVSDKAKKTTVHLAVSASGARYDALGKGAAEDKRWTMEWSSKCLANDEGLIFEIAVPWRSLATTGLERDSLLINVQTVQQDISRDAPYWAGSNGRVVQQTPGISEPLLSLGPDGRSRCTHFVSLGFGEAPAVQKRRFTVRMHFAELSNIEPGHRVFDVEMQGMTVLKDFDIVREAGGHRIALVKEFKNIEAGEELALGFISALKGPIAGREPIMSALEVLEE